MNVSAPDAQALLRRWSDVHGLLLLALTIAAVFARRPEIPGIAAAVSFAVVIFRMRGQWTPMGGFGLANSVTLARLLGICALAFLYSHIPGFVVAAMAVLLLALDGLDGWLARRRGESSLFGSVFDMETDALFTHILCVVAVSTGRLHPILLLIGLLRYVLTGFRVLVGLPLFHRAAPIGESPPAERRSIFGRMVFVLTAAALVYAFLPGAPFRNIFAGIALGLLAISFAPDFVQAWRDRGTP